MRRLGLVVALAVVGGGALAACFTSQAGPPDTGVETPDSPQGDDARPDSPAAPVEAGPDATIDSTVTEAAPDQATPEAGSEDAPQVSPEPSEEASIEASPEAAVEAAVEAGPDASVDAAADAIAEAAAAEAGPDATVADASLDAAPEASDASDAATLCIAQIFGDHYIRPDGELIYGPAGAHTLVTLASNGQPLLGITEIVQQSTDHACGLRNDGTVWCWALTSSAGYGNASGDLGNGIIGGPNLGTGVATQVVTSAADAGAPAYLTGVAHLSTASDTFYTFPTCAIRSDRTVWCWGDQYSLGGYLLQGTTGTTAAVPYAVPIAAAPADGGPPPTLQADEVSVGARHACVLSGGSVSCWGQNIAGNLADGDGTLAYKPYPVPVVTGYGLPSTVDAIGSGYDFSCALAGGGVWCWGTKGGNQIGNPSVASQVCNSNYCEQQPTPVQASGPDGGSTQVPDAGVDQNPLAGITSLLVGYQFACALDSAGNVWCWGAEVAGSTFLPMAVPYTSATVPYTGVTRITGSGEGVSDGLRYTTASGVFVSAGRAYAPYCQ